MRAGRAEEVRRMSADGHLHLLDQARVPAEVTGVHGQNGAGGEGETKTAINGRDDILPLTAD